MRATIIPSRADYYREFYEERAPSFDYSMITRIINAEDIILVCRRAARVNDKLLPADLEREELLPLVTEISQLTSYDEKSIFSFFSIKMSIDRWEGSYEDQFPHRYNPEIPF